MSHHLAQERDLAHRRIGEGHIGGRVLEQHGPPQHLLHLVDMRAHTRQRLLGVGQRQKVVEIDAVMARPGEMLGEERGLVAGDERPRQRCSRSRGPLPPIDSPTPCSSGVNLEPADVGRGVEDRAVMLGLEPGAGAGRERHRLAIVWAPRRHVR